MYDFFLDRFGRLDLLVNNAAVTGQTCALFGDVTGVSKNRGHEF